MRTTIVDLKQMKARGKKIAMITAYDYTSAKLLDETGVPIILVGDSLGNVVLGYSSTVPVTMEDMVHHVKSVVRGTDKAHVIGDMPFLSYHGDYSQAILNAGRLIQEGGAQSVKLEGGQTVTGVVRRIVDTGIPVMGHIGLTPQSVNQIGGYRVQGKTDKSADQLLADATALEEAGAYAVVLECVPANLASSITKRLSVPTIGIGAGPHCDGQVQVFHDMFGLFTDFVPKHARRYTDLAAAIRMATQKYISDVSSGEFPTAKESYDLDAKTIETYTEYNRQ